MNMLRKITALAFTVIALCTAEIASAQHVVNRRPAQRVVVTSRTHVVQPRRVYTHHYYRRPVVYKHHYRRVYHHHTYHRPVVVHRHY